MNEIRRDRKLRVTKTKQLSPHFKRITFFSDEFFDFSKNEKGGYLKLLFNYKDSKDKKLVRPYTIRNFREKELEIDIDFAIHESSTGIASKWASRASPGDEIIVTGPGAKTMLKDDADWFFFIGDMSSLPAISANLEEMDHKSRGIIVIEILSDEDKVKIIKPNNFKLVWVVNKELRDSNKLYNKVLSLKWLIGTPYVWVACEFNVMRKFRQFFQIEKKIKKEFSYFSSYWKDGNDQEQHKKIKQMDNKQWNQK